MKAYTTKELAQICKVPFYTVQYLCKLNKLPILVKGKRGVSTLYKEQAIQIIKEHGKNK